MEGSASKVRYNLREGSAVTDSHSPTVAKMQVARELSAYGCGTLG
jgi:hypothetical protein